MSKENKCEYLKDCLCTLPNYGMECHYGKEYKRCSAATFFREHGHTEYAKAANPQEKGDQNV